MAAMLPSTADSAGLRILGDLLPERPTQAQIEAFAALVQASAPVGPVDVVTMHHQADGIYGRSVTIPAGAVLVGLAHKKGCLVVCVGDITVVSEAGWQRITGACIIRSDPGGMRVGLAHADTTWLTVHATHLTDITAIEDSLVEHPERLMTRGTLQ
jgi:hypothetical protein